MITAIPKRSWLALRMKMPKVCPCNSGGVDSAVPTGQGKTVWPERIWKESVSISFKVPCWDTRMLRLLTSPTTWFPPWITANALVTLRATWIRKAQSAFGKCLRREAGPNRLWISV